MHCTDGNGSKQELRLGLKQIGAIVGLCVLGWGALVAVMALMFYPLADGRDLRKDVDHHIEDSTEEIGELKATGVKNAEALHRIELRQMETAPKWVKPRLPAVGPLPRDLPPGTLDP
jgi:hypothetical protein